MTNSLRGKIALGMALVALLATAAVGSIGYRTTSSRLLDEVDRSLTEVSVLVAARPDGRVRIPNRGQFGVYVVRVLDNEGETTRSSFSGEAPVEPPARRILGVARARNVASVTIGGVRYRIHTVGLEDGAVQVARPLTETDSVLNDVRQRTVLLVALVALIAAALGWMLAGTVIAPLRRLTKAAETVEQSGQLDVVVPGIGTDEVGRLGSAFRSMLGALQRSRSEQQRLVQDAGHELRTPLTSLRTNLAVMRRHPEMAADMQERILDDLDGEVTELTDLVNELVAVASGDLADQPPERFDLGELATSVADRVARRMSREIDVDSAQGGEIFAPIAGIERAITNLIQNATKFDESGSKIDVVLRQGSLTVLDRGPGIPNEDLARVFDRFHRADAARTMSGSGLGLAIVREVVERHGGTVSAAHRPGGGAAVGFSLPLADN